MAGDAIKTVTGVMVVLLLLASHATAQLAEMKQTTPEQRATVLTELMKRKLNLSGEQLQKVSDINLEYAQKMQPILQSSTGPLREMREMREVNEQKEAALKNVLSAPQFQQYLAVKNELREEFEQRIANRKAGQGAPTPAAAP